jgi:hypothetical protein
LSRIFSTFSSAPKKTISIARSSKPHSFNSGASGVPVHFTLPMAPMKPGLELLPEHSRVAAIVFRLRALSSARERVIGRLINPDISNRHWFASTVGVP